jgi:hypothetical protein
MLTSSRDKLWSWVNGELRDNEHLKKVSDKEVDVKEAKKAYVCSVDKASVLFTSYRIYVLAFERHFPPSSSRWLYLVQLNSEVRGCQAKEKSGVLRFKNSEFLGNLVFRNVRTAKAIT